jgi:EAL domain-containing protein (putative c-di-GMP-specific phosphodiesterase class I)
LILLKPYIGHEANIADYKGCTLSSVFQPIISIPHQRAVGYEGLVRGQTAEGKNCTPIEIFELPESSSEHLSLDRICRLLHIQNFSKQNLNNEWIFINLDSMCLANEKPTPGFMNRLFSISGIAPHRVVIEILESEIKDQAYLKDLIRHFRALGCLIAIDDFGAGHSNFDRIWELEPDIVKIDRNLIQRAAINPKVKRILSGMVSLIHEAGSLVIIEGVETELEAQTAIEVNADMVQGFYFAKPSAMISHQSFRSAIQNILASQQQARNKTSDDISYDSTAFQALFRKAVRKFRQLKQLEDFAQVIFQNERVVRCFILSEIGYQIGQSIHSGYYSERLDPRFMPLISADNANWSHKHYHFLAVQNPYVIQMSRPYLSIVGANLCITVSLAIEIDQQVYVVCCDLDWQDD